MTDTRLALLGVNLAGAEFGSVGQAYGTGYTYPTHAEVDYYASKGMNVIRLPFLWERLQPTLGGALVPAELGRVQDFVSYATSKGLKVVLDPHDYGNYNGNAVGSSAVPNSAFADLWGKIAANFQNNPNVIFGLMNEPGQSSAAGWLQSANAAIAAIRQTGASQEILVPGVNYDGAWTWTSSQNAGVIGAGVQDPLNNYAFEVHQYLDSDGSGTHPNVVSTTVGMDRLQAVTQWAEANGAKLFLGEFGVASDQTSLTALGNMLSYMDQNTSVWQGATYWAGGPWWGNYMYSAEPQNGVDSAQMAVLEQFAPKGVAPVYVHLGPGTNTVTCGSADEFVYGGGGSDTVRGGSGVDVLVGASGTEVLYGSGVDYQYGGSGLNIMVGSTSSSGTDYLYGRGGTDYVYDEGGSTYLFGGDGTERLFAGSGTNVMVGATTADSQGKTGINLMYGGTGANAGSDYDYAGIGTNVLVEGSGTDTFHGSSGTDYVYGGSGSSFVYGGSGTDYVYTGIGNQYVSAGTGNTFFEETAADLTSGRFDQIDNFQASTAATGGKGTFIYMPAADASATQFVDVKGGALVYTPAVNGTGYADIFVSGVNAATVKKQTVFNL